MMMTITPREELLNRVLFQILEDVNSRDMTAIEEMISHLPDSVLESYLPEGFADKEFIS